MAMTQDGQGGELVACLDKLKTALRAFLREVLPPLPLFPDRLRWEETVLSSLSEILSDEACANNKAAQSIEDLDTAALLKILSQYWDDLAKAYNEAEDYPYGGFYDDSRILLHRIQLIRPDAARQKHVVRKSVQILKDFANDVLGAEL